MKFQINIATLTLGILLSSYFVSAHAYLGSYMYCADKNAYDQDPTAWGWAPWGNNRVPAPTWLDSKHANIAEESDGDVWLYGQIVDLKQAHGYPSLHLINDSAYSNPDPDAFCQKLVKLCTDEYGPNYIFVGAGSGSVRGWNGISLYKSNDPSLTLYTCPNWWPGAFIKKSYFYDFDNNSYEVHCWNDTPQKGPNKFVYTYGPTVLKWSNGTVTYTAPNSDINHELLDKYVGLYYCTGQPSQE